MTTSSRINTTKYKTTNTQVKKPTKSFTITGSQRVFIAGKTGSGKSTLAKYLLANAKHLIVINGKDSQSLKEEWYLEDYKKSDLNLLRTHDKDFRIQLTNNMDDIVSVLSVAYEFGSCVIYIDEVTATIPPSTKPPQIFTDIWVRGRDRKIGGWANTQRPSGIPLIFLSEAEHLFMFRLNLENDRKRCAEVMGKGVLTPVKDIHGFYYYNDMSGNLSYYPRLDI